MRQNLRNDKLQQQQQQQQAKQPCEKQFVKQQIATSPGEKELADRTCTPCNGRVQALEHDRIKVLLAELQADWVLSDNSVSITRRYAFKGFAKSVYLSNLCVWLADQEGHHPDIAFGWGYCQVTLTTHDISGLSENDFIWAAKLDKLTAQN